MHASFPPYGQDPQLKPSIPRNPQQPTGAYRSTPEMSESERKLRTARHYLHHALLLVDEALKVSEPKPSKPEPERVPVTGVQTCALPI